MSSYNTPLVTCGLFANINVRTIGPVRFAGKQAGTEADLLWEKNIIPAEKTSWKVRIIRETNRAIMAIFVFSTAKLENMKSYDGYNLPAFYTY